MVSAVQREPEPSYPPREKRACWGLPKGEAACGGALEVTSGEANGERRSARTLAEGEAACGGALEVTSGEANGERRSARTLAEGEAACGGALKVTIGRSTNGRSSAFGALCLGSNPSRPARIVVRGW